MPLPCSVVLWITAALTPQVLGNPQNVVLLKGSNLTGQPVAEFDRNGSERVLLRSESGEILYNSKSPNTPNIPGYYIRLTTNAVQLMHASDTAVTFDDALIFELQLGERPNSVVVVVVDRLRCRRSRGRDDVDVSLSFSGRLNMTIWCTNAVRCSGQMLHDAVSGSAERSLRCKCPLETLSTIHAMVDEISLIEVGRSLRNPAMNVPRTVVRCADDEGGTTSRPTASESDDGPKTTATDDSEDPVPWTFKGQSTAMIVVMLFLITAIIASLIGGCIYHHLKRTVLPASEDGHNKPLGAECLLSQNANFT